MLPKAVGGNAHGAMRRAGWAREATVHRRQRLIEMPEVIAF